MGMAVKLKPKFKALTNNFIVAKLCNSETWEEEMGNKEIYEVHASICQCLANPKRLEIINTLRDKEMGVTELAEEMGITKANLSQHLAIMRDKGILKSRREGTNIYYSLANPKVIQACDIMREVLFEHLKERERLTKAVRREA